LQQTNTSLLHELDIVCIDLMQDYDDLASDWCQLDSVEDEINHLCGVKHDNIETIDDLHTEVNSLKAQLKEQDQSCPPHKLPCYG
jgi:hypothetical protein